MRLLFFVFLFLSGFSVQAQSTKTVVLAGGCFWCMQPPYDKLKSQGVVSTRVGYSGGLKANPTYEEVSSGTSGHIEAIEVAYDPAKITLAQLLEVFWKNIDPLDSKGQFCDKGEQYLSAFFYQNDDEKIAFEKSRTEIQKKLKKDVVTKLLAFKNFYPAEDYHQSYYTKNPVRYKFYRYNCRRDKRLNEIWKP